MNGRGYRRKYHVLGDSLVVVKSIDFIASLLGFKSPHCVTWSKLLNLSELQFLLVEIREGNDGINYIIP